MLLRKLVVSLCPLLMCLLLGIIFHWLDGLIGSAVFFSNVLKGLLLGASVGLMLPLAGITTRTNGLVNWLYVAAGLLTALLVYQYLEGIRLVHWAALQSLVPVKGPLVLAESTAVGFLLLSALLNRRR